MANLLSEYLAFPNLEKYNCVVWAYTASLSQMYVRLFSSQPDLEQHLYLVFLSVGYFSGPMRWSNSDFRIGADDEIGDLIKSGLMDVPDNMLTSYLNFHRLFISQKLTPTVRIVASANVQLITKPISNHITPGPGN